MSFQHREQLTSDRLLTRAGIRSASLAIAFFVSFSGAFTASAGELAPLPVPRLIVTPMLPVLGNPIVECIAIDLVKLTYGE